MRNSQTKRRNITPEKAIQILSKNGIHIDKNDAEELLDFMYFLAKLILEQNFKK